MPQKITRDVSFVFVLVCAHYFPHVHIMALCVPVSMPSGSATVACGAFYLILQKGSSISDPWPTPLKPFEPKRLLEMHLDWALHVLERGQGAGQTVCFFRNLMPPTLSFVRPAGQERLVTAYWGDQTAWTLHLRWFIFHTPSDDTTEKQNQPSTDPYHVLILCKTMLYLSM